MRIAVLDIGTNTILLLIADLDNQGSVKPIFLDHALSRLGRGVDHHRNILPETFALAEQTISALLKKTFPFYPDKVVACGTSFLRDAENKLDFIEFIARRCGLAIEVLSGDDEAVLSFRGALSGLDQSSLTDQVIVIDIGGGSTEIITGNRRTIANTASLNLGSVRLTERFLISSPPVSKELYEANSEIRKQLLSINPAHPGTLIGVAGTITTLAAIDLQLDQYDTDKIHGHNLSRRRIESIYESLVKKTTSELHQIPQILPERADIIVAGVLILLEVMDYLGMNEIITSDRGLRYGIAIREAGNLRKE